MASAKMIAASFLLMMAFFGAAMAETYTVDWVFGVDYNAWASAHAFRQGDAIRFRFPPHGGYADVELATEETFAQCRPDPNYNMRIARDQKFVLEHSGTYYFINGYPDACIHGWKLQINVVSNSDPAATPPPPLPTTPTAPFFPVTPAAPFFPITPATPLLPQMPPSPVLPSGAAPSSPSLSTLITFPLWFFIFSLFMH